MATNLSPRWRRWNVCLSFAVIFQRTFRWMERELDNYNLAIIVVSYQLLSHSYGTVTRSFLSCKDPPYEEPLLRIILHSRLHWIVNEASIRSMRYREGFARHCSDESWGIVENLSWPETCTLIQRKGECILFHIEEIKKLLEINNCFKFLTIRITRMKI